MDLRSFNSQAETFESSSRPEPCRLFTYYHPQYQPECLVHQDDKYASSVSKPYFKSGSFLGPLMIATLTSLSISGKLHLL